MPVVIVNSDPEIGTIWKRHLEMGGAEVLLCDSQECAVATLCKRKARVIVIDLDLRNGSALAVADLVSFRQPDAKIIFVTHSGMFSDGSIFNHVQNVCAYLPSSLKPEDLAALVEHYGRGDDPA